jgi:transposase
VIIQRRTPRIAGDLALDALSTGTAMTTSCGMPTAHRQLRMRTMSATGVNDVLNSDTLQAQITTLQGQVEAHFGRHPDAEIILSQPGLGSILGARVLGEFSDDPHRYTGARARKNYAGTSPITRQSGKKKTVHARHVHNDRLLDALAGQAQSALNASPGARAYYDQQRRRGLSHHATLRQAANRLVGILHGCLKTRTCYDGAIAWPPIVNAAATTNSPPMLP